MKSPILFLIFNRQDTAAQVFAAIREAKPPKLFIVADGPRPGNEHDAIYCPLTREVVKNIDWECEVHTQFRDKNLGCKYGINDAITWFFSHVEQGIILEDDCLPSPSFFAFCDDMLEKYKDNERVGVVSGNNFLQEKDKADLELPRDQYYFVSPIYTWGWATWRRAWNKQELEMESWPQAKKDKLLHTIFKNKNVAEYYAHTFDHSHVGRARTWDAPWLFTCLLHNMLCIVPPRNLISNIGVIGTTSTAEGSLQMLVTSTIDVTTLEHPVSATRDIAIEDALLTITNIDKPSMRRKSVELLQKTKLDGLVRAIYKRFHLKF